jgi:hypothetical protein
MPQIPAIVNLQAQTHRRLVMLAQVCVQPDPCDEETIYFPPNFMGPVALKL